MKKTIWSFSHLNNGVFYNKISIGSTKFQPALWIQIDFLLLFNNVQYKYQY